MSFLFPGKTNGRPQHTLRLHFFRKPHGLREDEGKPIIVHGKPNACQKLILVAWLQQGTKQKPLPLVCVESKKTWCCPVEPRRHLRLLGSDEENLMCSPRDSSHF